MNKFWTGFKKNSFMIILKFDFYFKQLRVEQLQNIKIK